MWEAFQHFQPKVNRKWAKVSQTKVSQIRYPIFICIICKLYNLKNMRYIHIHIVCIICKLFAKHAKHATVMQNIQNMLMVHANRPWVFKLHILLKKTSPIEGSGRPTWWESQLLAHKQWTSTSKSRAGVRGGPGEEGVVGYVGGPALVAGRPCFTPRRVPAYCLKDMQARPLWSRGARASPLVYEQRAFAVSSFGPEAEALRQERCPRDT